MKSRPCIVHLLLSMLLSCGPQVGINTPTSGALIVVADPGIAPVVDSSAAIFMQRYPGAKIRIENLSATQAMADFLSGVAPVLVTTFAADSGGKPGEKGRERVSHKRDIAWDGVAVIVNIQNSMEDITVQQLLEVQNGNVKNWSSLSGKDQDVIFIAAGPEYAISKLLKPEDETPLKAEAVKRRENFSDHPMEVVKSVARNAGGIGLISNVWFRTPSFQSYSDSIKTLKVASGTMNSASLPHPAFIYRGDYPLRRTVFVYHDEKDLLGAGFVAFLCGNEGQALILRSGMVPRVNPVRLKYD